MFVVETRFGCEMFEDYCEAEVFCATHGIHPEEIVDEDEEDLDCDYLDEGLEVGFDPYGGCYTFDC